MHIPTAVHPVASDALHSAAARSHNFATEARAAESITAPQARDHLSTLPSEHLAKLAAHLPLADQIRLQGVNKALRRDLAYAPGQTHEFDPLAADALQRGGYWVHVARLARGELAPTTTVTIDTLRKTGADWPTLMSFVARFPRAGQARALVQLAQRTVDPAERLAIRAHPAVTDEALAALAARPLDQLEAHALRDHPAAGPQTLIALGTRANENEVHLSEEEVLACLNHPRANDASLAVLYQDATEHQLSEMLHEHAKFGDATNAENCKMVLDEDYESAAGSWSETAEIFAAMRSEKVGDLTLAVVADAARNHLFESGIRLALGAAAAAGPKTLTQLASGGASEPERMVLAMHKNATDASLAVLAPLATSGIEQSVILAHPKVGDETLAQFADASFDRNTCLRLRNDPRAGDATFAEYAKWGVDAAARRALFSNPRIGAKTLAELAIGARDRAERTALRMHPAADSAVLEALAAGTPTATERRAISQHPEANDATIAQLIRFAHNRAELAALVAHPQCGDLTSAALLKPSAQRVRDEADILAILSHPNTGDETLALLIRETPNLDIRMRLCGASMIPPVGTQSLAAFYAVAVPKHTGPIEALIDQDKVTDPRVAAICAEMVTRWNGIRTLIPHLRGDVDALYAEIARHTVDPTERKLLLESRGSGDATLAGLAATASDPQEIFALRYDRRAGDQTLRHFAASAAAATDPAERTALRQHRNVGDATLAALASNASDPMEISALREHRKAGEVTFATLALRAQRDLAAINTPHF